MEAIQRDIVRRGLAEAESGVDDDVFVFDTSLFGGSNPLRKPILHVGHHIIIDRVLLHISRSSLDVHEADRDA